MNKIKQSILAIFIGLALAAGVSWAAGTWSDPTADPTGNNTEAPINVGASTQYKNGALGVGGVFSADSTSNFTGLATFKTIKITEGAGSDKVLTSDADGNATWKTTKAGGSTGLSGAGTVSYLSKWASASSLGNSGVYDNGTSIGIGTTNPDSGTKLDVSGKIKTTNLQVTNGAGADKVLTSDGSGNASWKQAGDVKVGDKNCKWTVTDQCTEGNWNSKCGAGGYVRNIKSERGVGGNCGGSSVNAKISVQCCEF